MFTSSTSNPVEEEYYNGDFPVGYKVTDETALASVNVSLRRFDNWAWSGNCYDNLAVASNTKIISGTCQMDTDAASTSGDLLAHDGKFFVSIFGFDLGGNVSENATRIVNIDKTLPVLNITSATNTEDDLSFEGYVSDTNLNYYYCWLTKKDDSTEIEGIRNGACVTKWALGEDHFGTSTSPVELGGFDISDLVDGDYTIHLVAKDKAGNQTPEVSYDTTINRSSETEGDGDEDENTPTNQPQLLSFSGGTLPFTSYTFNPTLTAPQGEVAGATAYQFTQNLKLGSIGEEVKALQKFLNLKGFVLAISGAGSLGQETNYFGFRTRDALIKYQEANPIILTSVGINDGVGTGNFFSSTRDFVNEILLNDSATSQALSGNQN